MVFHSWRALLCAALSMALSACGGGGDSSVAPAPAPAPVAPAPVVPPPVLLDSFGQVVPTDSSQKDFAPGDSGADGTVGVSYANQSYLGGRVRFVDVNGKTKDSTDVDILGHYRINITDMTPPFVVKFKPWYQQAPSWEVVGVSTVEKKANGFTTINANYLTKKIAMEVAKAAGLSGTSLLTPADVAAQKDAIANAIRSQRTALADVIADAGLNNTNYDPINTPYKLYSDYSNNHFGNSYDGDGYDYVARQSFNIDGHYPYFKRVDYVRLGSGAKYAGTYLGTYPRGTFTIIIDSKGRVSTGSNSNGRTFALDGIVDANGNCDCSVNHEYLIGTINAQGVLAGEWHNNPAGIFIDYGPFTATRQP